jgi:hypothetical protein
MFPGDTACTAYLTQLRWPGGFICPSCRVASKPWIESRGRLPGRPSGCPPGPPQTRTCPIKAYGSSGMTLLPCAIHWDFADTIGELKVSPVIPPSRTSCPASPSLPWVPWASVPHAHRYYSKAKTAYCPFRSLRSSLVSRYPVLPLYSLVDARERTSTPGLLSQPAALRDRRFVAGRQQALPSSRATP